MKKQTKSNLRNSLQSLGVVLLVFFAMAFACNDGEVDSSDPRNSQQAIPPLEYSYVSAFTKRADGSMITGSASGSLLLLADGKYKHTRYIGSILNVWKPGTYSIAGDKLILTPDDKSERKEVWKFYYSQSAQALSLMTNDNSLGYLLVMAGTEGMTRCENGKMTFDLSCE
jgi:hypothetical protein